MKKGVKNMTNALAADRRNVMCRRPP